MPGYSTDKQKESIHTNFKILRQTYAILKVKILTLVVTKSEMFFIFAVPSLAVISSKTLLESTSYEKISAKNGNVFIGYCSLTFGYLFLTNFFLSDFVIERISRTRFNYSLNGMTRTAYNLSNIILATSKAAILLFILIGTFIFQISKFYKEVNIFMFFLINLSSLIGTHSLCSCLQYFVAESWVLGITSIITLLPLISFSDINPNLFKYKLQFIPFTLVILEFTDEQYSLFEWKRLLKSLILTFMYIILAFLLQILLDKDFSGEKKIFRINTAETKEQRCFLEIKNLTKIYEDNFKALNKLSVTFNDNSINIILGHNGAGKTTFLNILSGFEQPNSGSFFYNGKKIKSLKNLLKGKLSFGTLLKDSLFEHFSQANFFTAFKNCQVNWYLHFLAELKLIKNPKREIKRIKKLFGLDDMYRRSIGGISLGMLIKMKIASALIGDPKFVILDEPSSSLDALNTKMVWDLIKKLKSPGRIVLCSTNKIQEIQNIADKILILNKGERVLDARKEELEEEIEGAKKIELDNKLDILLRQELEGNGAFFKSEKIFVVGRFYKGEISDIISLLENKQLNFIIEKAGFDDLLENFFVEKYKSVKALKNDIEQFSEKNLKKKNSFEVGKVEIFKEKSNKNSKITHTDNSTINFSNLNKPLLIKENHKNKEQSKEKEPISSKFKNSKSRRLSSDIQDQIMKPSLRPRLSTNFTSSFYKKS